jgi:hypothetical protein
VAVGNTPAYCDTESITATITLTVQTQDKVKKLCRKENFVEHSEQDLYLISREKPFLLSVKNNVGYQFVTLMNSVLDLIGGGLAPSSQSIRSFLRTHWSVKNGFRLSVIRVSK